MNDFRNGLRKSAEPRKANTNAMITIAKAMTPEEIKAAAEYFGAMTWTPWISVVEASTVPKMESRGRHLDSGRRRRKEPIGMRIIETPENPERTEILRDPRSGFIAYVPVGSIKKGEALVKTGGNGRPTRAACATAPICRASVRCRASPDDRRAIWRVRCTTCRSGARHGEWTELMKPVVAKLTEEDLVNIAAYVSSRARRRADATRWTPSDRTLRTLKFQVSTLTATCLKLET